MAGSGELEDLGDVRDAVKDLQRQMDSIEDKVMMERLEDIAIEDELAIVQEMMERQEGSLRDKLNVLDQIADHRDELRLVEKVNFLYTRLKDLQEKVDGKNAEDRFSAINERLEDLDTRIAEVSGGDADVGELEDRLQRIEDDITALQHREPELGEDAVREVADEVEDRVQDRIAEMAGDVDAESIKDDVIETIKPEFVELRDRVDELADQTDAVAELRTAVGDLQERVDGMDQGGSGELAEAVDSLQDRVAALEDQSAADVGERVDDLVERVDAIEGGASDEALSAIEDRVDALEDQIEAGVSDIDTAQLKQDIAQELEDTVGESPSPAHSAAIESLEDRTDDLEETVAELRDTVVDVAEAGDTAGVDEQRLDLLLEALEEGLAAEDEKLEDRVRMLQEAIDDAVAEQEAAGSADLVAVEERLAEMEERFEQELAASRVDEDAIRDVIKADIEAELGIDDEAASENTMQALATMVRQNQERIAQVQELLEKKLKEVEQDHPIIIE